MPSSLSPGGGDEGASLYVPRSVKPRPTLPRRSLTRLRTIADSDERGGELPLHFAFGVASRRARDVMHQAGHAFARGRVGGSPLVVESPVRL